MNTVKIVVVSLCAVIVGYLIYTRVHQSHVAVAPAISVPTQEFVDTNNRSETIKVGQSVTLDFDENKTTGYSWSLGDWDKNIVELVDDQYQTASTDSKLMGAGGVRKLTFMGKSVGTVQITLQYVRPWEKDVAPAKETKIIVVVE